MATSIDLDMGEVSRNKKRTMWKGIFMKRRRRMNELAMAAAVAMMVSGFNVGAMAAEARQRNRSVYQNVWKSDSSDLCRG